MHIVARTQSDLFYIWSICGTILETAVIVFDRMCRVTTIIVFLKTWTKIVEYSKEVNKVK